MSIDYTNFKFPKTTKHVLNRKIKDISKQSREYIKNLFKGQCGLCGKQGTECHHIFYRSEARTRIDDVTNLFLLCIECHKMVHSNKKNWQPRLVGLRKNIK